MQKNWYIMYTKPKCEIKVANILTKKKINAFCPTTFKQIKYLRRNKSLSEPLFNCYVFAKMEEKDLPLVRQIENVVSVVYWKGKPAIISCEEIEAIMDFTTVHQDIRIEKTDINKDLETINMDQPVYRMNGNLLMIKNRYIKVNLPSLGYKMIAKLEEESILDRHISFSNRDLQLQS